jgi:hypothetical protein
MPHGSGVHVSHFKPCLYVDTVELADKVKLADQPAQLGDDGGE